MVEHESTGDDIFWGDYTLTFERLDSGAVRIDMKGVREVD